MRIAALYDVHGNLPALEAVLDEVAVVGVEGVVVGGDVLPGPFPREALAALARLPVDVRFLRGNGENDVLSVVAGRMPERVPEAAHRVLRWTASALEEGDVETISAWPDTVGFDVPGHGRVLFCHATPDSDAAIFTRATPEGPLVPVFDRDGADVVVCGHTHMAFDRRVGRVRVVNAGSVGMPFGGSGADWLLLAEDVQLRHTAYDLEEAAERIRATDYPGAETFAAGCVLDPPSEASMLEAFARVAISSPSPKGGANERLA